MRVEHRRDPGAVRRILESLPDWFGDPDAISTYVEDVTDEHLTSLTALEGDTVVGIALVNRHFPESAELHLIAVAPEARGRGIGRRLVTRITSDLAADGCRLLSVHTVGPSSDDKPYAGTREFYRALGFTPLEEHVGLDWPGPSLILVRTL
jgi:ribosomal protein S18 acetylase RimI-like enzyme